MELVERKNFNRTLNGNKVDLFNLRNQNGMTVQITNYGARIVSWFVPDRNGHFEDVVLGYDSLDAYLQDPFYIGATIGRYANRIADGRFVLFGKEFQLTTNENSNHLHGGSDGLHRKVWDARQNAENEIQLTCLSHHGEEGYPGAISVELFYRLFDDNSLQILCTARTDQPTILNLTHHSCFNLKGAGNGDILDHLIQINSMDFTPVDARLIPTGDILPVVETPFDFRDFHAIGERIDQDDEQLNIAKGYDHNYIIQIGRQRLEHAATVIEKQSGRRLKVYSTEPGLQFYSGNFLTDTEGKRGKRFKQRSAFCLEAQHFPDSPNKPHFPMTLLLPPQIYRHETIYKFDIADE